MSVTVSNTTSNLSGKTIVIADATVSVTGAWTFNRSPSAPFAVQAGSAAVANLDADKLDGLEATAFGKIPVVLTSTSTGAQNNWAPGTLSTSITLIEWNGASDAAVTGLDTGVAGYEVTIKNVTAAKIITFAHASGSSDADNQFTNMATSAVTPVAPGGWVRYQHNGTTWKMTGHDQGAWITPTFDAAHFTGNASMTWTVASGDVTLMRYHLSGKKLTVAFSINTTTVGGTPNTTLQIASGQLGSFTAVSSQVTAPIMALDNGALIAGVPAVFTAAASGTLSLVVNLSTPAWTASTDATYVRGEITFEVT